MDKKPTIIITGSSGFIGSNLVAYFAGLGFNIRAFQRKAGAGNNPLVSYFHFELSDIKDEQFRGADYLVHCAYQILIGKNRGSNVNMEGTKKIIAICRKYGIKIIFLSTLSAHPEAESNYGRQKLAMESLFDLQKDLVLKPGLVLGRDGGVFGKIVSILKKARIIPLVGGGKQQIQVIAADDLCRIIELGINKNISGKFMAANPEIISMKELYIEIAKRMNKKIFFIPLPVSFVYFILRFMEALGIRLPITSENTLGLKKLKTFDTAADLKRLGVAVKNYRSALNELKIFR